MSSIVSFAFSLGGFLVVLLAAVAWVSHRPSSRSARRFLIVVAIGFTATSVYAVPFAMSRVLVAGYRPIDRRALPAGRSAIVLLGSADIAVGNWDGELLPIPDLDGATRMWETVRLARALPDAWVISSGGGPQPAPAVTMREAMIRAGIPASRILVEDRSANTRDEAIMVAPMLRALNVDHVVLVTSDIHMRRSVGTFQAAGVPVIPAIARDPFLSASWRKWLLPSTDGLDLTRRAAHEVVGLAGYGARGWLRFF